MGIFFKKLFAQLLFWIYDFIDTIGAIFNILTGTQGVSGDKLDKSLLEVFADSAISTKVLLGLCSVAVVITGASMGVKIVKNVVKFKSGGEQTSNAVTVKQGFLAILSSVVCIFFVFLFIAFASMLLNMVNDVISPQNGNTLSQNLFDLSVGKSYVLDESKICEREVDYYDEFGNPVQKQDPSSPDGLMWETDANGNQILDENGNAIPVYEKKIERYYDYFRDEQGNPILDTGWVGSYTASDISWSMDPDEVFGKHEKDWIGLFEEEDEGYTIKPMVRLDSFNIFTAYLVAIIILISMFMLCVGLVKRIYDIIVLIICMPLVCGTIPLDDGARFRAWRETFMSKVLVAFGAVIAINVFYMITGFVSGEFSSTMNELVDRGILGGGTVTVFKMLLLMGGAMCINGSQALIARILGTSADESREAMQSFAMITSGIRMGAAGAMTAGRMTMGAKRAVFGGTNRYGRQRTGIIPMGFRGVNAIGERAGGANYVNSRGAAFVRKLGRMGGKTGGNGLSNNNSNAAQSGSEGRAQPAPIGGLLKPVGALRGTGGNSSKASAGFSSANRLVNTGSAAMSRSQPASLNNISNNITQASKENNSQRPNVEGLRSNDSGHKSSAYKSDSRSKR